MFAIEIPFCDLNLMYKSKQSFRWIKVNDGKYVIPHKNKIVLVQQKKDKKALLCSEDDFYDYWFNYFDIGYDYLESSRQIDNFMKCYCKNNLYIKIVLEQNMNLRIIKNDLLESMFYFILNDKEKYNFLLSLIGIKKHNTLDGLSINWYELPPINNLNITSSRFTRIPQVEFETLSYINYKVKQNPSIQEDLVLCDKYSDVYKMLEKVYNNPIWIKSVMFYSLGFKEAFPIKEEDKQKLEMLKLKPSYFKEYNNIKGLLLEYTKLIKRKGE